MTQKKETAKVFTCEEIYTILECLNYGKLGYRPKESFKKFIELDEYEKLKKQLGECSWKVLALEKQLLASEKTAEFWKIQHKGLQVLLSESVSKEKVKEIISKYNNATSNISTINILNNILVDLGKLSIKEE